MRNRRNHINFKLELEANLDSLKKFYGYIISERFIVDLKKEFTRSTNLTFIRATVQQVVEDEIYSIGMETGNIKRSFDAVPSPGNEIEITVFSDPSVATSKGPFYSGNPEDFSYAAFFEKPADFNSFIPSTDGDLHNSIRYRPFMTPMVNSIYAPTHTAALYAFMAIIKRKLPRKQVDSND